MTESIKGEFGSAKIRSFEIPIGFVAGRIVWKFNNGSIGLLQPIQTIDSIPGEVVIPFLQQVGCKVVLYGDVSGRSGCRVRDIVANECRV